MKNEIYFDINNQKIVSCNKKTINNLEVGDDKKEESVYIHWEYLKNNSKRPSISLDINNIPKGYNVTTGGLKRHKPFRLKPNNSYLIEKSGGGMPKAKIRIWTDSIGRVYKTTNPECGMEYLE